MVREKSILYLTGLILALSACNIRSSKLINTSWVVDLEAYASISPPKGFEEKGTSIEFEQDSIYTGQVYYTESNTDSKRTFFYVGNATIPVIYKNEFIIDFFSKKGDTLMLEVKKHIVDKCLVLSIPYVEKDVYLKPAPDFDRSNRPKYAPLPPPRLKEDVD